MWTEGQLLTQLKDGLSFGLFASGMYIASQFGRFFSLSALSTPFFAAAMFALLRSSVGLPLLVAMIGGALGAGLLSSALSTIFHENGRTDRMTAGLLVYFIILACGKACSTHGTVKRPLGIDAPGEMSSTVLLACTLVGVLCILAFWSRTLSGLRVRAFSQTPEFAGRFGFSEYAPYFPALLVGEAVVGGVGVLTVYIEGNVNWDYAFMPGMIGIAAASMVEGWLSAKRCSLKCLVLVGLVFCWRLSFTAAHYWSQQYRQLRDLDYAFMAILMVLVSVSLMAATRLKSWKRNVDD